MQKKVSLTRKRGDPVKERNRKSNYALRLKVITFTGTNIIHITSEKGQHRDLNVSDLLPCSQYPSEQDHPRFNIEQNGHMFGNVKLEPTLVCGTRVLLAKRLTLIWGMLTMIECQIILTGDPDAFPTFVITISVTVIGILSMIAGGQTA